ncbi:MAG: CHAP domain-containing protein [Cyanobacteria bacterium SIG29]|nr:CHAP domain-containing protein [Cyanobacteria bacterium SIG29]
MNFESLKIGFVQYIKEKNQSEMSNLPNDISDISIFMYASEFKEYIAEELNIDTSILNKSINEILSMEIENGKLVDPNEENTKSLVNNDENGDINQQPIIAPDTQEGLPTGAPTSENAQPMIPSEGNPPIDASELITGLLNNLFNDENFMNFVDNDKNGELNKDEMINFFNSIKNNDYNEENISLEDILIATDEIKENSFKITTPETVKESVQAEVPITKAPSSSGYSNGGGSSYNNYSSSDTSSKTEEKNISNMSESDLKNELKISEGDLEKNQKALSSLYDGSDEKLKSMNENAESLYTTYQEKLKLVDVEMAEQVDTLKTNITNKETELNNKDQEISTQENTISKAENTYKNATASKENLKATKESLENVDKSEMSSEKSADLSNKINTISEQITQAEEAEKAALEVLNEEKEKLNTLNEQRKTIETDLNTLKTEMSGLEEQISTEYPEIAEYMNQYNKAKQDADKYKEEQISVEKGNIQTTQNRINEINSALSKIKDRDTVKDYMLDGLTEETRKAIELAYSQLGVYEDKGDNRGTMEKYGGRAGDPWCASFVSWLYGKGQEGSDSPITYTAAVSGLRDQAQKAGYYSKVGTYTPVPGDIMIQKSNGASHTGIVVGVDDKYIYTIEGNSGDAVRERKYEIGSSAYSKISGWIRMNEWTGGSSDIPRDTYLANNNSEDAEKKNRSTV